VGHGRKSKIAISKPHTVSIVKSLEFRSLYAGRAETEALLVTSQSPKWSESANTNIVTREKKKNPPVLKMTSSPRHPILTGL